MPKKKARKASRARSAQRPQPRTPARQPAATKLVLAKGEQLAGVTVYENKPHQLVVMSIDAIDQTNHEAALAAARKAGGDLPSRIDGLVLHARLNEKFKTDRYYWTNEIYAGCSSNAWRQWFGYGSQGHWYRSDSGRVCVVRRAPL